MTADELGREIRRTQGALRCLDEAEAAAKVVLMAIYRARRMCGIGDLLPIYESHSAKTAHLQDHRVTPGTVKVISEIRQAQEKVEDRIERFIEQRRALTRKPAVH